MHKIQFKFQKSLIFWGPTYRSSTSRPSWRTSIPHTSFIFPPPCPISKYATGPFSKGYVLNWY